MFAENMIAKYSTYIITDKYIYKGFGISSLN
jgi:hypothetical protein